MPGIGHSLLGIAAGAAIPLVLYAIGALGGGDVKLMGGIGAWLGAGPVFAVFMLQAVIGLGIVLVQAVSQGRIRALLRNSALIAVGFAYASELGLENAVQSGKRCRSIDRPLPYAVPVFVATVIVLAMSRLVGS
jgi:prepilin peptidase CpaA